MTKAPFTGKGERASDFLDLIHTDVCGPVNKLARVEKTPYEMWYRKRPNMSFLKIWGCEAYVKRLSLDNLGPKSDKCYFVGYPKEIRGYYFYNPIKGKVFIARTAVIQEARRSGRLRHEPERYGFLVTQDNDILLIDNDEPTTYAEAVTGLDFEKWLKTMRSEMESMYTNQVWTLVDPPKGVKPIGCKWVFKKKTDMDNNVITFKGRLVAKGFRRVHGIDYDETFSLVAMLKSIRILLAIAAYYDYEIWHMDVKTAFLNGRLLEDVHDTT
ncbi:hypothetical protein CRG98_004791 [Punica granatum]|uniref:Uncharacterized protein n=1 Tax=Punica granatum TaxID=22663 RepID=A0A2I0L2C6_PUNGR|nr:hypothetical protein CRG98_004791 [Punica granatum]